ncbi:unnamed protein product, partial [Brassica rapa subsp. trilocularis]
DNTSGVVIGLDLGVNSLEGEINSSSSLFRLKINSISNLKHLNVLRLHDYNFSGLIPSSLLANIHLSDLKELTLLNLSNTLSSGTVPTELLHLTKLVSLDLSSNSLSAQKSFLNNLSQNLTNLEELNLGLVDISSEIPPNISKLSSLKSLSLDECNLFGKLPSSIFMIPTMQSINLQGNQDMVGSLPEFNRNNSLVFLDLSWISLGNLPVSINNLKHLTTLKLGFCNLHGQISSSLGNLTNLSTLDLSSNFFNGHIP